MKNQTAQKRKRITEEEKRIAWEKTDGHCHFCGEQMVFEAKRGERGRWQIDHIYPFSRGGTDRMPNYLPICRVCNRLRWHFESKKIRELLRLGTVAFSEIKNQTYLGKRIKELYKEREEKNKQTRRGNLPEWYYK